MKAKESKTKRRKRATLLALKIREQEIKRELRLH